jgi:membrane-bound lytic murein transglycosylase B
MNRFGWRVTGDVVLRAAARDPALAEPLVRQGIRPAFGMAELTAAGIVPERRLRDGEFAAVLLYEGESGPEYWLGLENFWVITRYNRSQNYALAAWQLGERIAAAKGPVRTGRSR